MGVSRWREAETRRLASPGRAWGRGPARAGLTGSAARPAAPAAPAAALIDSTLQAALALWKYAEETVRYVFGNSLGNRIADEILLTLQANPTGMSRDDIRQLFNRHRSSHEIARALGLLLSNKLAHCKNQPTGGRPEERWFAGSDSAP